MGFGLVVDQTGLGGEGDKTKGKEGQVEDIKIRNYGLSLGTWGTRWRLGIGIDIEV